MSEDFNFEKFGEEFNLQMIAMEEIARTIVPMYLAYKKQGLSVQEAAALTAAMIAHTLPQTPPPSTTEE